MRGSVMTDVVITSSHAASVAPAENAALLIVSLSESDRRQFSSRSRAEAPPLLLDRVRFERGLAVFHVHAELHALRAVLLHQRVAILAQALRELLVREPVDVFAALLLGGDELL